MAQAKNTRVLALRELQPEWCLLQQPLPVRQPRFGTPTSVDPRMIWILSICIHMLIICYQLLPWLICYQLLPIVYHYWLIVWFIICLPYFTKQNLLTAARCGLKAIPEAALGPEVGSSRWPRRVHFVESINCRPQFDGISSLQ